MNDNLEKIYFNEDLYICGGDNYNIYKDPHFYYKGSIFEIPNIKKWNNRENLSIDFDDIIDFEWFNEINEDFPTISNIETMRVIWNSLNSDNIYVERFDKCCETK